jgi:hypothetical protein
MHSSPYIGANGTSREWASRLIIGATQYSFENSKARQLFPNLGEEFWQEFSQLIDQLPTEIAILWLNEASSIITAAHPELIAPRPTQSGCETQGVGF